VEAPAPHPAAAVHPPARRFEPPHLPVEIDLTVASLPARSELVGRRRDVAGETLAVLGRTLFGRPLEEQAAELGFHVDRVLRYMAARFRRPIRAPIWLPTPPRARMRASRAAIDAMSAEVIASTRAGAGSELVEQLLQATDPETGEPLSTEALASELFVFLAAGHDTTATVLTAALWLLGRHPDVQDAVAEEASGVPDPTYADLPRLDLTGRVLQEAMRLYPPAAAMIRRALEEGSACGYRIPAGADVIVSTWAIHRDPALWPDPTRFDSDRFLPERSAERDRWSYLPFGAGARRCIGEHFAFAEAALGLSGLVRRFRFAPLRDELPVHVPFTLTVEGPVPVRIAARER
jgi:cytochrome P450